VIDPFLGVLEEAIARTGTHRLRYLCLEHPDEKVRREYSGLVADIAAGTYTGQRFDPSAEPITGKCCDGYNPMALPN
jgi:hypothetical protein